MKDASYPHTHSPGERYAQERCARAVDRPGRGQQLRSCPHPLDNSLNPQYEPDISNLRNTGHFYFALTLSCRWVVDALTEVIPCVSFQQ